MGTPTTPDQFFTFFSSTTFYVNNIKNIEHQIQNTSHQEHWSLNSKYHEQCSLHINKTKSAIIVVEGNGDASVDHYGKKHSNGEDQSLWGTKSHFDNLKKNQTCQSELQQKKE